MAVECGGIRMVPVETASGTFRVWTRRSGESATCRLLTLHGGPGATHEYLLGFDSFLPQAGIEVYYYDQLGSGWSDNPGIEYALAHQEHLAGLVISNMMASIPAYNRYADEVLMSEHYPKHVLRLPVEEWPEPVTRSFSRINHDIYVPMQGPSELGASGALVDWDRFDDLARIDVPTLVIGGAHDTMDPEHLRAMAERLPQGEYLHCPEGSHLSMYDDQVTYMFGLVDWLHRQSS